MKAAVCAALLLRSSAAGKVHPTGPTLDERSRTTGCSLLSLESSVRSGSLLGLDDRAESKRRPALRGRGLLQTGTLSSAALVKEMGTQSGAALAEQRGDVSGPFSAGWFGDFSQGESTYRTDGLDSRPSFPERHAEQNDFYPRTEGDAGDAGFAGVVMAKPDSWFQETESGGAERAWQTYYPAVGNFRSREQEIAPWRGNSAGTFQELYKPDEKVDELAASTETKTASWFDSSVSQYDAFGRGKLPSKESNERYVEWKRRSRSVNISCADPGCEVNASLKLFDHAREAHGDCKLSFHVHPTDFDDEFSREYAELVHINGRVLNLRCHPKASERRGCAEEALLQPCIKDYALDGLVGKDGKLELTSRISPMVDECPVDGRLLSGEIVVVCLVHPSWLAPPDPEQPPSQWTTTPPPSRVAKLQCSEPGCTASATVLLEEEDLANKTCRLTIRIAQTDFDGDHGSIEEVEWVKVEGNTTREHAKPGGNPCKGDAGDAADPGPSSLAQAAIGNASDAAASPANNGSNAITAKPGNSTASTGANGGGAGAGAPGSPGATTAGAGSGAGAGAPGSRSTTTAGPDSGAGAGAPGSHSTAGNGAGAGAPGSPGTTSAGAPGSPGSGAGAGAPGSPGAPGSHGTTTAGPGSGAGAGAPGSPDTTTAGPGSGAGAGAPGAGGAGAPGSPGSGAGAGAPGVRTTTASPASAGPPGGAGSTGTTTAGPGSGAGAGAPGVRTNAAPPGGAPRNTTATGDPNSNDTAYSLLGSSTTMVPDTTGTTTQHAGGGILGATLGGGGALSANTGSVVEDEKKLDEHRYLLLNGTDVTEAAQDGHVEVSVKISAMVDECGSNGFLLDAEAIIECS